MKKAAAKMGRPRIPKKEALGEIFCGRLRPDEAREVKKAIETSNVSRSAWVRDALVEKARRA